ncbi:hypothetical protein GCM10023261_15210 [Bartonella jaculi]|uniref:Uncharacterized protein n=1 Tax=Bartonella jaculi TaxID=686226 RepID=A0ABP9NAI9_9HYPH
MYATKPLYSLGGEVLLCHLTVMLVLAMRMAKGKRLVSRLKLLNLEGTKDENSYTDLASAFAGGACAAGGSSFAA